MREGLLVVILLWSRFAIELRLGDFPWSGFANRVLRVERPGGKSRSKCRERTEQKGDRFPGKPEFQVNLTLGYGSVGIVAIVVAMGRFYNGHSFDAVQHDCLKGLKFEYPIGR